MTCAIPCVNYVLVMLGFCERLIGVSWLGVDCWACYMVLDSICRFWLLYRFVLLFPGGLPPVFWGLSFSW